MARPRIGFACLVLLTVISTSCTLILPALAGEPQVQAESSPRKAEADQLNVIGIRLAQARQTAAALQYFQQAMTIYREIKDHQGEGNAVGNMGTAYNLVGDHVKAIEYYQQWLALARESKDYQSQRRALKSLGNAYADLGDIPNATMYYQQELAIAKEHPNHK